MDLSYFQGHFCVSEIHRANLKFELDSLGPHSEHISITLTLYETLKYIETSVTNLIFQSGFESSSNSPLSNLTIF